MYVQEKKIIWPDLLLFRNRYDCPIYDAHMGICTCRGTYHYGVLVRFREVIYVKEMKIRVIKMPRIVSNILKKILRIKN